jgi:hypothetical protein
VSESSLARQRLLCRDPFVVLISLLVSCRSFQHPVAGEGQLHQSDRVQSSVRCSPAHFAHHLLLQLCAHRRRASRTFPFISKTLDANFITLATQVMMGYACRPYNISLMGSALHLSFFTLFDRSPIYAVVVEYDYVAVKAPIFSFTRLRGADPTLGVEMASTGEVACFGHDALPLRCDSI